MDQWQARESYYSEKSEQEEQIFEFKLNVDMIVNVFVW